MHNELGQVIQLILFLILLFLYHLFKIRVIKDCQITQYNFNNLFNAPIIIKSLTALEAKMDIYPEYTNDTTSSVNINLNPDEAITTLVFEQENSADTLILTYALIPEFISSDCGIFIQFNDLDTISTTFDNLKLIQPIIDDEVDTNIEIIN